MPLRLCSGKRQPHLVLAVDELADLAVGIAGDVDQRAVVLGRLVQAVDRHDGEKLAQRPVIEQRLEDGEIAEELVAERILELLDFLRHRLGAGEKPHHALGDFPEERLDLRLGREVEQAEVEARLRVVLDLHGVVEMLAAVLAVERGAQVEQLRDRLGRFAGGRREFLRLGLLDHAEDVDHEHGMVRDDGAAAFAHQRGMRHLLLVADVGHVIDHIAGILAQRVIGARVVGRAAAVVVDAQPAAHIEVLQAEAELLELRIVARALAHGAFHRLDVGNLRADVEVHQLEAILHLVGAQQLGRLHHLRGGKAELCVLAAARAPLAGAFRQEPDAHADDWLHAELLGDLDDRAQFLDLLHHHDDSLAQLAAEQRHPDVELVLVAVADDERFGIAMNGQRGEEFRLAADLDAEVEGRAGILDFLHHLAQLVDLDREDAAVGRLVLRVGDRGVEFVVEHVHAVPQQILETEQQREDQPARFCLLHYRHKVKGEALVVAPGAHGHVARVVNAEVGIAPPGDVVSLESAGYVPRL